MRHQYCCNKEAYQRYYVNQAGGGAGMPYFSGSQYQKGFGLGSIFSSLGKAVLPLVKQGAKTLGRQVLKSGASFASDLLEGKNIKKAAISRSKEVGANMLKNITTFPGTPQIRKRKKKMNRNKNAKRRKTKDIFS